MSKNGMIMPGQTVPPEFDSRKDTYNIKPSLLELDAWEHLKEILELSDDDIFDTPPEEDMAPRDVDQVDILQLTYAVNQPLEKLEPYASEILTCVSKLGLKPIIPVKYWDRI